MRNMIIFISMLFLAIFSINNAFAIEPIMITISSDMDKVIFDGKWTHGTEWKRSSLNTISYDDGTIIQLRTAHQDNFIYVFIDDIYSDHFSKGSDMAIICFDSHNSKNKTATNNDYCFESFLESTSTTLQGGSSLASTSNFKKIEDPIGYIGIGGISDQNDRYSTTPHESYEFRIPTNVIERSDVYGFYMALYDTHSNKIYSWPQNITSDFSVKIPSPDKWGEIISPDKSLPEFPTSFVVLVIGFSLFIYMTRNKLVQFRN